MRQVFNVKTIKEKYCIIFFNKKICVIYSLLALNRAPDATYPRNPRGSVEDHCSKLIILQKTHKIIFLKLFSLSQILEFLLIFKSMLEGETRGVKIKITRKHLKKKNHHRLSCTESELLRIIYISCQRGSFGN